MKFKSLMITTLFVVIALVGASISALFWYASSDMAEEIAQNLFEKQTKSAEESFRTLLASAGASAAVGAVQPDAAASPDQFLSADVLPMTIETLRQHPDFYSLYYGFEDGTFYQVIATRGLRSIIDRHEAPGETAWIVRSIIDHGVRKQQWAFLDEQGTPLVQRVDLSPDYNPTKRPWYIASKGKTKVRISEPYLFHSLQQPGLTVSKALEGGDGVYGVDLTLAELTNKVSSLPVSDTGGLVLYDRNEKLIAMSSRLGKADAMTDVRDIDRPAVNVILAMEDQSAAVRLRKVEGSDGDYFVSRERITFADVDFILGAVAPVDDFRGVFTKLQQDILMLSIVSLLLLVPVSYFFASGLSGRVTAMTDAANRMRKFEFEGQKLTKSHIVEFDALVDSFSELSTSLGSKTEQLNSSQAKLSRLVETGISMTAEQDSNKLMEMLLLGAKELTNADGGSLYVLNEDNQLEFRIFRNDRLDAGAASGSASLSPPPNIPMIREDGSPNLSNVVSFAAHQEESINIDDVYTSDKFDFAGPRAFDEKMNYRTGSILTVPLKPRGGAVIGAMQIINAREKGTDTIVPFSSDDQPFVEALAAQASTSLYNRQLLQAQVNLMDSMIMLIAEAIDSKSPYTGGHCNRVPILAQNLARAASDGKQGCYADFSFDTKEQWREFEIGAWLHDCGKIVTPEYVVDKASKLETIYNRIHEIRTRFEVLLRDARIDCLQAIIDGADAGKAETQYEARKQRLIDDFAFVAECNIGGEFMSDESIDRLKQIADTTWQRNFDIHLGLAHEEALRYEDEPVGPCPEKLLDDKHFHVIPRTRDVKEIMAQRGFKMEVPEALYNQGEVYNLSIRRGTLTAEERFKINDHIMQSIVMLEKLPLPPHLQRVPEYAGTHHETLIGTGYPRKLTADELSVPARIMAIADIFEALTASDRPYKKAKSLSEAVKILSFFKKDEHIDPDLFDLFLTSGVYLDYANEFLDPEQIDDVNIEQYLG